MIRPASTLAHAAVVATCPSCGHEVSRLGAALWSHIAQCNPELFHAYIAGELALADGPGDALSELLPHANATLATAAVNAKSAALERWTQHQALLSTLVVE